MIVLPHDKRNLTNKKIYKVTRCKNNLKKSMAFIKTSKPVKGCDDRENHICNKNKEESICRSTLDESMCKTYMKKTFKYKNVQVQP